MPAPLAPAVRYARFDAARVKRGTSAAYPHLLGHAEAIEREFRPLLPREGLRPVPPDLFYHLALYDSARAYLEWDAGAHASLRLEFGLDVPVGLEVRADWAKVAGPELVAAAVARVAPVAARLAARLAELAERRAASRYD